MPLSCELYLVRHGETTANRDGILQGQCDFPLTSKGQREAAQVGAALADVPFHRYFASDLRRVMHTSEILLSTHKHYNAAVDPLRPNPLLRELNFGVREMQHRDVPYEEALRRYAERMNVPVDEVVDAAESLEDVLERQRQFLVDVLHPEVKALSIAPATAKVLCVAHGGFIKRFLKKWCGADAVDGISNCSINKVLVQWPSDTDGREYTCSIEPADINDVRHIKEDVVLDDGSN
jgi:broad specificity phosphatase PhoE